MKITYDWLKDHLKTSHTEEKLLKQLTNVGLEVERLKAYQMDKIYLKLPKY